MNDCEFDVERKNLIPSTISVPPSDRITRLHSLSSRHDLLVEALYHGAGSLACTSEEPVYVPQNLIKMWKPQSQPSNLNDLPAEILLRIMDCVPPFFRARALPLVSRRMYHLEKQFWIDCRPIRSSRHSCPKKEFAQRYSCLKPELQRALRNNGNIIPLQSTLIPSSYVALSHLLLSEASETRQQDTRTLEGICRALANVCRSTSLSDNAMRLRHATKAQARTHDTLMVHIVDAVRAVVKVESAQPTPNISDLHLTRFMFRSTSDAVRAVCEALECRVFLPC